MKKIIFNLFLTVLLINLVGCAALQGPAGEKGDKGDTGLPGEQGEQGIQGIPGEEGRSVVSITLTRTVKNVDTYTILYSDNTTSKFDVTNGIDGVQGIQGEPGKNGHTPIITIVNGYWYIDDVNTNVLAEGIKGDNGNGISSIILTSSVGLIDTYTITYTNGEKTTFTVKNGEKGEQGISPEFKIEEGLVFISYDNGKSWQQIGDLNTYELDFDYVKLDDATVTITGYKGESKDVVVPDKIIDEGKEYTVRAIESGAFYFRSDLTSITLPNTIETIGDFAFYYCSNIKELVIPTSVTYIGLDILVGCYRLESISIPFTGSSKNSTNTFGYLFGTQYYSHSTKIDQGKYYYIPNSLKNITITDDKIVSSSFTGL